MLFVFYFFILFFFIFIFIFFFSHLEIKDKNNGILHSLIFTLSEFPFDILKILENHRILLVSIILDFNLFTFFLLLFRNFFSAHLGI